jgi:acetyltransferase-like isoleucine patch superfamily enzyme
MANIRRAVVLGDNAPARLARGTYRAARRFHLPVPRLVGKPLLWLFVAARSTYYVLVRLIVCEPILRASCRRHGRNLRTGVYVPWIAGTGDLVFGDDCNVVGKLTVVFAARFSERPTLQVGNKTGIGHDCDFSVADRITIGNYCHVAGGTRMFDSSGHPLDPAKRLADLPPDAEDVKPITIGDNVWIGARCTIFPGVTIGENSVVATGSVVTGDVPPNTLVAGYPARQIKRLS